jgi:hypothetical protein
MAGFEVIIYGRFWVITEVPTTISSICIWVANSCISLSYISFAKPKPIGWLGGVFVRASDLTAALKRCDELGINPGGEAAPCTCHGNIDSKLIDRLLNREELETAFGGVEKFRAGVRVCESCNEGRTGAQDHAPVYGRTLPI